MGLTTTMVKGRQRTFTVTKRIAFTAAPTVPPFFHPRPLPASPPLISGRAGTLTLFQVTGQVLIRQRHTISLFSPYTGGPGSSETLGTANNVDGLVTAADWQNFTTWWRNGTFDTEVSGAAIVDVVSADITLTITGAVLFGGEVEFYLLWSPWSADGSIVPTASGSER